MQSAIMRVRGGRSTKFQSREENHNKLLSYSKRQNEFQKITSVYRFTMQYFFS